MSVSVNGYLDSLKLHMLPFKISVPMEHGGLLDLWALPMRYDFHAERAKRAAIEARLKADASLEGAILDDALQYELVCEFLKEHLVQPPKEPGAGFAIGELPQPLFEDIARVSATLSYSVIFGAHRQIQEKGFGLVREALLKNS